MLGSSKPLPAGGGLIHVLGATMLFELIPKDNHSHMVGSCDLLDPSSGCPACSVCGYRDDTDFTASNFTLRQMRYDFSCCYDGAIIVSDRFRSIYASQFGKRLDFVALTHAPGFFHLKCTVPIKLDYTIMGTTRSRLCSGCNRYRDVIGCSRIVISPGSEISSNEVAFSDWRFGSNNEASPLVIAGSAFVEAAKANQLTGIGSYVPIGA